MIPLPNASIKPATPFLQAKTVLEQWLDGYGRAFIARSHLPNSRRKASSWDIDLDHPVIGRQTIQLSMPQDFPATPPQVHFSKLLCLKLPHIEEDGKFCHGVNPSANDYEDPCRVVIEVLNKLSKFWTDITNPAWVAAEFQRECLAYWNRFCYIYQKEGKPAPRNTYAVLTSISEVTEGRVASYHAKGPGRSGSRHDAEFRGTKVLLTQGVIDPHTIAVQHGWAIGTLFRGVALWIPLPSDLPWGPNTWPRSLKQLERLVLASSNNEHSVVAWLKRKIEQNIKKGNGGLYQPMFVVLVQGRTCYGYMISPNLIPRLTPPGIVPIEIQRVDADWALARDYNLELLETRRKKRVLLLGCGSLGGPIAELLARGGVGELHLADKEFFSIENCARHILGAEHVGMAKAIALADRIRRQIPGSKVKPLRVLAADWVSEACSPGQYDLVIDCTGEGAVRTMLTRFREKAFGDAGIVHVWLEPFGAAAHAVYVNLKQPWPYDDPWEKVNAASWPNDVRVQLPACGSGFHPYGAADAWQVASFASERIFACLNAEVPISMIWSWVRSSAYFDKLNVPTVRGAIIPSGGTIFDACHVTRPLAEVL